MKCIYRTVTDVGVHQTENGCVPKKDVSPSIYQQQWLLNMSLQLPLKVMNARQVNDLKRIVIRVSVQTPDLQYAH